MSQKQLSENSNLSWLEALIIASPAIGAISYLMPYGKVLFLGSINGIYIGSISGIYNGVIPLIIDLLSLVIALSITFPGKLRQKLPNKYINLLLIVIVPLFISNIIALYPVWSVWHYQNESHQAIEQCTAQVDPLSKLLVCLPFAYLTGKVNESLFTPEIGLYLLLFSSIYSIFLWLFWFLRHQLSRSTTS